MSDWSRALPEAVAQLLSSTGLMPHGHCYLWREDLIFLHVFSDGVIAASYFSIPLTLVHIVRKRKDIPFDWMFMCFSLFIVACGLTHVMEIWTLWRPDYWVSGALKLIAAVASVTTALLLIRLVPTALAIPSPNALADAHTALRAAHEALESKIEARTSELTLKNEELVAENAERKRLETVSHAKSEFLSSMSHELRTPLNAVLGFAQLLQRDKREPLSERHRERVDQIQQGGEHLLHLINELLDLSRIEAGTLTVALEPCELRTTVAYVQKTLEGLAASNAVRLQFEERAFAMVRVTADSTRLAQVLINFGSNAIKYNRPQGEVVFGVSELGDQRVRICVRDNGLGIPADKQARLFQAFERAGREGGSIEGTGVGLFITKRLAELMHGEVGFRSAAGEGSEFWIDLPRFIATPDAADDASLSSPDVSAR